MSIAANIAQVQAEIAAACARADRAPAGVTLVAVSKTHPPAAILQAVEAGLRHFGENRVEESETKIPATIAQTDEPLIWHMIGHIQSRKAKQIPPLYQVVHSVDTLKLAAKLSQQLTAAADTLDVLLETNVSGEASKAGFAAAGWHTDPAIRERLLAEIGQIVALPGLNVRGLMTMAPIVADAAQTRPIFADLRQLRDLLADSLHHPLPDLSMGMTDDYPVAIEEGATIVRIGRAIFGERQTER
ncbi:MAG: YggS family pyridoxal phosphate-dependent enzyme [Chloroflexi bacterium]|nr:YggS family pyridoxal phosphate-dependent enzyme [Chloroflexota bacterium]